MEGWSLARDGQTHFFFSTDIGSCENIVSLCRRLEMKDPQYGEPSGLICTFCQRRLTEKRDLERRQLAYEPTKTRA
jgi:hypothetical protein